jgi:hypothetical protein
MTIQTDGKVGIGTTNPDAKLNVTGRIVSGKDGAGARPSWITNSTTRGMFVGNGSDNAFFGLKNRASGGSNKYNTQIYFGDDPDDDLVFENQDNGELMRLTGNGRVGIGTDNPDKTLEVQGTQKWNISSGGNLILDGAIGGSSTSDFRNTGGDIRFSAADQNSGGGNIRFYTSGRNQRMMIQTNGNVGIGTGNPEALLHVGDLFGSGGENLQIGDDAYMSDLDIANTIGLYGKQDPTQGSIKFGSSGPRVSGNNGRLWVCGKLSADEVKVQQIPGKWCDYVFKEDYDLRSMEALEAFVDSNHHLPDIPPADDVAKNGLNVGDMQKRLLKKVEELTLYVLALNKRNKQLRQEKKQMKDQNKDLSKKVEAMNKQLETLQQQMQKLQDEQASASR